MSSKKLIVVIVPFADFKPEEKRAHQLKQFLTHMTKLIKSATSPVKMCIVVAEQNRPNCYFNRGQLLNAGVKWYVDHHTQPDFIIFHDVDMLPDKTLFSEYLKINGSISLVPQDIEYKKKYGRVVLSAGGGIFGISYIDFIAANGYPNGFFTWGGEDDAFGKRLEAVNRSNFIRVHKGHITHIDSQRQSHKSKLEYLRKNKIRSMMVHENLAEDKLNWKSDGYNNIQYKPVDIFEVEGICVYIIKFNLDEKNLEKTIAHNNQVYKELSGGGTIA